MKHGFPSKRSARQSFPPDKLYVILRNILPKESADETYTHLTNLEPSKDEPNASNRELTYGNQ